MAAKICHGMTYIIVASPYPARARGPAGSGGDPVAGFDPPGRAAGRFDVHFGLNASDIRSLLKPGVGAPFWVA